jgi:hypothetical protein
MTNKYVIFDLDNCLSDDSARIPLIDWSKTGEERYAAYHMQAAKDPVNKAALDVLLAEMRHGFIPIFITARPTIMRGATIFWIEEELGLRIGTKSGAPMLFMRQTADERKSVLVKRDVLEVLSTKHGIIPRYIERAYDDRQDILNMYRDYGIDPVMLRAHDMDAYNPPEGFVDSNIGAIPVSKLIEIDGCKIDVSVQVDLSNAQRLRRADEILQDMANTFRERNAVYGNNYRMVAKLVAVLFPDGVPPELVVTDQWHLFELKLVKLSRFAVSGLKHKDSIHDDAIYSAIIESIIEEQEFKSCAEKPPHHPV